MEQNSLCKFSIKGTLRKSFMCKISGILNLISGSLVVFKFFSSGRPFCSVKLNHFYNFVRGNNV